MPEYLAPGVYVEETSFRSKIIEGVSTTTTGFVGPARYGPVIVTPDVVTSVTEFETIYLDGAQLIFRDVNGIEQPAMDNFLWHAVRAFFTEGGQRLYISRVFRPLDPTLTYPLDPGPQMGGKNLGDDQDPVYVDGHARPRGSDFPIRSRFPGEASNMIVTVTLQAGQNILGAEADDTGASGSPATTTYQPKLGALLDHDVVFIERKLTSPSNSSGQPEGFALATFDAVQKNWRFTFLASPADPNGILLDDLDLDVTPEPNQGDSMVVVTAMIQALSLDGTDRGTWSLLPLDPGHEYSGQPDSIFAIFSPNPASLADARSLPIIFGPATSGSTGLDVVQQLLEIYSSQAAATNGSPPSIPVTADFQKGTVQFFFELVGGNDGQRPGAADYEGRDVEETSANFPMPYQTGLLQFEDIDEISIVAAPGSTFDYTKGYRDDANTIFGLLIAHAEKMRYRVAVLDSPPAMSVGDIRRVRAKLDSEYAALYYPWVTVLDPITRKEFNLPPSGFVTGIYARNDINRGVWKAPANEVVNLAINFEQVLNKAQQEVLNPEGINCFRYFEDRGFRLWGARTISSDPEWKYVNVRRYFAYLEHSIDKGTQWAVFEPNGERLWANVRRTISDFLLNEWQQGALLGDKPEKAYFVRCDRSTMTQNDLDNGRLVCLIGVAPLYPAEFVIFRIGQWTADAKT